MDDKQRRPSDHSDLSPTSDAGARPSQRLESPHTANGADEPGTPSPQEHWGMQVSVFTMLMHLAQLTHLIIPLSGFVLPVVMWVMEKERSSLVDLHGRVVINWMITAMGYALLFTLLRGIGIGSLLLAVLWVVGIVFAIIGGIKANQGVVWPYPLSYDFMGVRDRLARGQAEPV